MTTRFDTWLVNGNITIFCGSHTDSFKKDILASQLLGELIANKKSNNRETSWPTYKETLQKTGWITNSQSSRRLDFNRISFVKVATQSAGDALTLDERQALTSAMAQLASLPPASVAMRTIIHKLESNVVESQLDTDTVTSTAALFTIVRGNKTVVTQQVTFETALSLCVDMFERPILSASKDRRTNSWQLCSVLEEKIYSRVRDEVIKKLGSNIETNLLHVQATTT